MTISPAQNPTAPSGGPGRRRRRGGRPSGTPGPARPAPHASTSTAAPSGPPVGHTHRPAAPRPTATRAPAPETAPIATVATPTTATAPDARSFADLGVPPALVRVVHDAGIFTPFPIQSATLPDTLAGRDVLGRGRTGSGKTLAFALPMVARLSSSPSPRRPLRPRALVLAPTRELVNQISATLTPLAAAAGLRTAVVFGGVGQNPQVSALRAGVDVLLACPGRLEDLIGQGFCDLGAVEVTVLDEADHMADLGFLPGVKRLMDRTPREGQRMLFSATLDNGVDVLVRRYLSDPVTHSVDSARSPVTAMDHHVLAVPAADKPALVRELAGGQGRSLLFLRTKHTAKKMARQLTAAGIPAVELHGNLSQNARERNLAAYSSGEVKVLVATDIAARGIHVDDVGLVVHVDPPTEHKAYLHRSGRTARAGAQGVVVTVMTPDQTGDVRTLARQAGIRPRWVSVAPGSAEVRELVGPAAAYVEPPPAPAPQQQQGGGGRGGGGRGSGSRSGGRSRGSSSGGGTGSTSTGSGAVARSPRGVVMAAGSTRGAAGASARAGARRGSGGRRPR